MIASPDRPNARRALERAIIHAFFLPGSAARIAQSLSTDARPLHASDVLRIWASAKENGELPKIDRPAGGPRGELTSQGKSQGEIDLVRTQAEREVGFA
jgi:hypothetical protein